MPSFLPPSDIIRGKAGGLQIPRCQGFAVDYYDFTLGRLGSEALRLLQRWGELVELKRKDRLLFIANKLYNHPEQMIPPFRSMDEFIANYRKGLVLPEHDVSTPIILG